MSYEYLACLVFYISLLRQVFKMKIKGYIPDFKLAFEHFCIHTGGRGVIEEIEKQLQLAPDNVQPSKDTLFRYGNTSSSSIWSVLAAETAVTATCWRPTMDCDTINVSQLAKQDAHSQEHALCCQHLILPPPLPPPPCQYDHDMNGQNLKEGC